jgi:hypothetical protein
MDWTPFIHAAIAVAAQVLVGLVTGNWWLGGAMACSWWAAREHTQAEYRWIAAYAGGRRAAMPWWGGFDLRIWDRGSVLDAAVPAAFCLVVWLLH